MSMSHVTPRLILATAPSSSTNESCHIRATAPCSSTDDGTHPMPQESCHMSMSHSANAYTPHEKLLGIIDGITWVSNPATRKDLAASTWGVFWYQTKVPILFKIMVQIKQKRGTGVKNPSPKSLWCGVILTRDRATRRRHTP